MTTAPYFHPAISNYWNEQFPIAPTSLSSVGIFSQLDLDSDHRVMILERPNGETRVAMTPEIFNQLGCLPNDGLSLGQLKALLTNTGVQLHGADFVFYFPMFVTAQLHDMELAPSIRELTKADETLFKAFEAAASEEDLDGASVGLDDRIVLGAFEGEQLVAVASIYQWDDSPLGDVGVLTLAASRRKGHAANLIKGCASRALGEGLHLQYRCQTDNTGSAALATSLGLELYGRWTAETP